MAEETGGGFERAGDKILDAVAAGMYQSGLDIMYVSQREVPVDTGTLKSSGQVGMPERGPTAIEVTLGYGYGEAVNPKTGEIAAEYAVPVHERVFVKHAPPTKAKFLEDPATAYAMLYGATLELWIRRVDASDGAVSIFMDDITPGENASVLAGLEGMSGDEVRSAVASLSGSIASSRGMA